MKYFQILADDNNVQPRLKDWYEVVGPGMRPIAEVHGKLRKRNSFRVVLSEEAEFMDILTYPEFMVCREFAYVIQMYNSAIKMKSIVLFDDEHFRAMSYQMPDLPLISCLSAESELSRDRSQVITGILDKDKLTRDPIFRVENLNGRCIVANMEFVESVYRRHVMGMRIREFMVK